MSYSVGSSVPVPETAKQLDLLAMEITNLERVVEHGERRLQNLSSRLCETPNIALRSNLQAGLQNEQRRLAAARRTIPRWRQAWELGETRIHGSDSESSSSLSRRSSGESSRSSFSDNLDFMDDVRDLDDIRDRDDLGCRFLKRTSA